MGSPAAGGCVLVVLGGTVFAAVFAASPTTGVLTVWAAGVTALWRAAHRMPKIDNPSPPPPEAPSIETKPQFTSLPDPDNIHRTHIVWHHRETPS